ncbi:MAG: TPM domain-containing protein [Proteobacteria bacterium]|nr:TPM domain-containing protein [Pseudomonadota bacterium]HQR03109.1 TPM domain-containing protein [Rhodocyclaceae bacterium]
MRPGRIFRHLLTPRWWSHRPFGRATLDAIEQAIHAAESGHRGELRFVIEGPMPWQALWRGEMARSRAIRLFSDLRVWDTEHNSGILIYLQLVDHHLEILADRGIAARVPQMQWDAICRAMEDEFSRGRFHEGALAAVAQAAELLRTHFPAQDRGDNELPDRPVVL